MTRLEDCQKEVDVLNHLYCFSAEHSARPACFEALERAVWLSRASAPQAVVPPSAGAVEDEADPVRDEVEFLNYLPSWAV